MLYESRNKALRRCPHLSQCRFVGIDDIYFDEHDGIVVEINDWFAVDDVGILQSMGVTIFLNNPPAQV
jgi:hypothetical protein